MRDRVSRAMFGGNGYKVELTPRAWAQIGTLARGEFEHVRETITEFAARLAREPVVAGDPQTLRTGALLLSCSIDPARRVVLLQSLARELAER